MRTSRLVPLLAVLALLVGALAWGTRDRGEPAAAPDPRVEALRAQAALDPCPAGLGTEVPDLVLPCLGGGADVALRQAPGTPLLVNVWATWCGPCLEEVPLLVDAAARGEGRLGVVGVLTQDALDSALTYAREQGIRYPSVVDDDGEVLRAYGSGPPQTLLVTADGEVAFVKSGAFRDAAELDALVAEHLGVAL